MSPSSEEKTFCRLKKDGRLRPLQSAMAAKVSRVTLDRKMAGEGSRRRTCANGQDKKLLHAEKQTECKSVECSIYPCLAIETERKGH